MAKLKKLPGQNIIDALKGKIDFYVWMGIPVARRWPRSPGRRRAEPVEARWPAFTTAARLWNSLSPEVQLAYKNMASGLNVTGRDVFIKGYLSTSWLKM